MSNSGEEPRRYPKDKVMEMANHVLKESEGKAQVFFKAECPFCGTDCVCTEPNVWYDKLECINCGRQFNVTLAGFMLVLKMK